MIFALDTATVTGWAAGRPGSSPMWGARSFRGDSTGEIIAQFRYWLEARILEHKPTLICFEAPYIPRQQKPGRDAKFYGPPINAITLRRLLALAATVEAAAWEHRIPCREKTPLEISKFFIGTARLKRVEKKLATVDMCRRYGWETVSEDAADALALWAMAEAALDPAAARARGIGPLFVTTAKRKPVEKSVENLGI